MLRNVRWCGLLSLTFLVVAWELSNSCKSADVEGRPKPTGWYPLFNGKDLAGWQVKAGKAHVVDGRLRLERNTTIETVQKFNFDHASFRMEFEAEGHFVVSVLDEVSMILDDLRPFPQQQRKRPVEAYIIVTPLGDKLYRLTLAYSRAWAISFGSNVVHSKPGKYPLRIETLPETSVTFRYLEVSGDGIGLFQ